ncbi:MAG: Slp family lipoprotein [Dokdonella sp.]
MLKQLFVAAGLLGLTACATVPAPLQGNFVASTPRAAPAVGETVRWGGEVIRVEPKTSTTCVEVLGHELGSTARPVDTDRSNGRFMACQNGFIEPGDYPKGREVTVIGRLSGTVTGRVGEFDYVYPRVAASTIYLWPKRVQRVAGYGSGFYDPFWGSPWGWNGGFGYGFGYPYGQRPIIIVKPRPPAPPPAPSMQRRK